MITIISKIELEGTENLKYTDVGYTTDTYLINEINKNYDLSLGSFLAENRTKLETNEINIDVFFTSISYINEARVETENEDDTLLIEIMNINEL